MSNDLIWRQSVIELIDDLMKSPYANSPQFGAERRECMDLVKELCVHRLTTAYDVDKVIERLEQQKNQYFRRAEEIKNKFGENYESQKNYGKACSYDHAIEITKSGYIA